MSELTQVKKEVKQELKKNNPFNLIDVYFAISKKIFSYKNLKKIKEGEKCKMI